MYGDTLVQAFVGFIDFKDSMKTIKVRLLITYTLIICAAYMFNSCVSTLKRYSTVKYIWEVPCVWNNDDIYYVSNRDGYGVQRYAINFNKRYSVASFDTDTAVISFAIDLNDSLLYMIRLPISYREYTGYIPDGGGGPSEIEHFKRIVRAVHTTSNFGVYDMRNLCWQYETTFTVALENILMAPDSDSIIVSAVTYAEKQIGKITDNISGIGFQIVDISVYSFSPLPNRFSLLLEHAFALGFLPDSSLLLYQKVGGGWQLLALRNGQLRGVTTNLQLNRLLPKIRLHPFTFYLTWFDRDTQAVKFHNLATNHTTSIGALSSCYCVSPDISKLAFLIYDDEEGRVKPIIIPTGIVQTSR